MALDFRSEVLLATQAFGGDKINCKKIQKNPQHKGRKPDAIPLNAASNGAKLSLQCSIFVLGQYWLTGWMIGPSFLGTHGFPGS
jgi:hypothetical protein